MTSDLWTRPGGDGEGERGREREGERESESEREREREMKNEVMEKVVRGDPLMYY